MPVPNLPPPPQDIASVLFCDARTVRDLAGFRLEEYTFQGRPAWVLAIVTPGPLSGSATVPGSYLDGKTGRMVVPKEGLAVEVIEGTWKALATAPQSNAHQEGKYSWTVELRRKRSMDAEDYYSAFAKGGTILFQPHPGASGSAQFKAARLFFEDWIADLGAAFDFAQQHPSNLGSIQFEHLSSENNNLLSVLAFSRQLSKGAMTPKLASDLLTHAARNLDSVLTYLILEHSGAESGGPLVHAIETVIGASKDTGKLRSLALGSFAAAVFLGTDSTVSSHSKDVLNMVSKRLKELGKNPEEDPFLLAIFENLELTH
jgi:hypothetical protein